MLVGSQDPRRCIFEHAKELRKEGASAPLTLVSHPELAVVALDQRKEAGGDTLIVAQCALNVNTLGAQHTSIYCSDLINRLIDRGSIFH